MVDLRDGHRSPAGAAAVPRSEESGLKATGTAGNHGPTDPDQGCSPTQPEEHRSGSATQCAHRDHRPVGVRQVLPGARHPLRGRPAALRRGPVHLREAVSRPAGETRRRPDRGTLPRGGHRTAQPHHHQPLHSGHCDRGLRLPPPPLRACRPHPLPRMRRRGAPGHRLHRHRQGRRPVPRHAGDDRLPAGPERPGFAPARCGKPSLAGIRAGARRRRGRRAVRPAGSRGRTGRDRSRSGRQPGGAGRGGPDQGGGEPRPELDGPRGRFAGDLFQGGRGRSNGDSGGGRSVSAAPLLRGVSLPTPSRVDLSGAGAQALLLQQPLRQLPGLHRLRGHAGVRPRLDRAGSRSLAGAGRGRPLGQAPLHARAGGAASFRVSRAGLVVCLLGRAAPLLPPGGALRKGVVPRRDGLPRLQGAQAVQAVHPHLPAAIPAPASVPRLPRLAPPPRGGLRVGRGTRHRRGLRPSHREAPGLAVAARSPRHGGRHRHHDPEGALGADRLPCRCRARLPDPRPPDAHPFGRGGAANLPRQLPGLAPGRHALRPRRAVDRSAPPGHGRAPRPPEAAARRGQHGGGGGARRRRDHGRRPRRGTRPGLG